MSNSQAEKMLFTYDEAAALAGVSAALIRKLVAAGTLEKIKVGRAARIPRHALMVLCGVRTE